MHVKHQARAALLTYMTVALCFGATSNGSAQELDISLPDVSLAETSTLTDRPSPKLGEVREFTGAVAGVNCSRWEVVALDSDGQTVSECGTNKLYFKQDDHLNLHKATGPKDANILVFEPSYPGIEFPLKVGNHWHRPYAGYLAIEGLRWEGDLNCEVAEFSEVTVVAGTFKAYRIECHDNWTVGQTGSSLNSTTWYAPEIGGVVKTITYEDSRWNSELKAFSR
ncbi:MAG: hypothetical protein EXR86_07490 [Gammaproteobacteria bacterium]|nr:hypothetical protein [Gammaproteobacteria bacterium]